MKKYLLIALLLAATPAIATTPPNPCGNHGNNCDPDPPTTIPGNQSQIQSNDQDQQQNATGTGTGIAVAGGGAANAAGGAGGAGGHGGTAVAGGGSATGGSAQGGAGGTATSGSASGAISGSLSGVHGSGNASLGDVGSNSSADALSNASNGDQSLSGTQTVANTNGGNQTASGASADASGNSTVNVGGDRNSYKALYIPSVIPQGQLAITSAGNLSVTDAACGPLMAIEREPQQVLVKGMFGGTKLKQVGYTERLVPYTENGVWKTQLELEIRGVVHTYGHRITRYAAQNGTAMASGISIGGGGNNGWGQAGTNGSSSVQQVQKQYDLALCELDVIEPQLPAIEFSEPRVPRG